MKLEAVLIEQEREEVAKLKQLLVDAQTRSDIDYYTKEINKILDRAEARYHASKEIDQSEQAAAIAQ
mgnify:CR=1 FL=1